MAFIFFYNALMRLFPWIFALFILCQCAVKHQPRVFEPFFYFKPSNHLTSGHVAERRILEATTNLTHLQQRRLLRLYQLELNNLDRGSKHYEMVADEAAYLKSELYQLAEEIAEVREEAKDLAASNRKKKKQRKLIRPGPLKRAYDVAYKLWNANDNAEALESVQALNRNTSLLEAAEDEEIYKLSYLRFRIAVDVGDLAIAEKAYLKLVELEECDKQTAKSGFLLSLFYFASQKPDRALKIYQSRCDEDDTITGRIQRAYWNARFEDRQGNDGGAYRTLFSFQAPGYYAYMAAMRLNRKVQFSSQSLLGRSYLKGQLEVPGQIHELWEKAEIRLDVNLKKDADRFLTLSSRILRNKEGAEWIPSLLYNAHLLQAAGSQLEAMRIYSTVWETIAETENSFGMFDFIQEMFPRPHRIKVEALARQWKVDPDIVYALMRQESAFNPEAVSVADARGLLQLMPFLARALADQWGYGVYYQDRALYHGEENLKWAIFHLYQLRRKAPHLALMAASYNAGFARVSQWWKRFGHLPLDIFVELIPVSETRKYVKLVIRNYLYYKALRENGLVRKWISLTLPTYIDKKLSE